MRAAAIVVVAALAAVLGGFGAFRLLGSGSVLGDVRVLDAELGGLSEEAASERLSRLEEEIAGTQLLADVDGTVTDVVGEQVGPRIDPGVVDTAMEVGRRGGILAEFGWWIDSLFDDPVRLDPGLTIDPERADQLFEAWNRDLIGMPPFPGAIEVVDGRATARYPEVGVAVDREEATRLLTEGLADRTSEVIAIPTVRTIPLTTEADLDSAAALANVWIGNAITLTAPSGDVDVVFTSADLANALRSDVDLDGTITLGFDEAVIDSILLNQRDSLEAAPVDARLEIDGYDVLVVPGRNGTLIDSSATVATLEELAPTSTRRGPLPVEEGAEPEVTTADLEALGIEHMVVQFTTYHDCCQARVTNIQLIADEIDGAIVLPGEVFGINDHVGERTAEKGYLDAGSIVRGELVESVGGGISQFATTLYNTVFWGGYEDVRHKPHSFYFSRYPEGIESTVSYPAPEMSFRNDTDSALLLKTAYTDTSITVRIFGENDGRIIAGAHRNGNTSFEIVAEGGADARVVRASVSERTDFTEPDIEYRPNPEVAPGSQNETQRPRQGWTVVVTRTIEHRGSETQQTWTVRYLPQRQILEVHPCEVPGSGVACPTTTTPPPPPPSTTAPPESSTSAP